MIIDLITDVEDNEPPSLLYEDIQQELCCCWHDVSFTMKHEDVAEQTEPTTQTETQNSKKNSNVISVYDGVSEAVRCAMCNNPNKSDRGCDGACSYDKKLYERIIKAIVESIVDTPQMERESE